jgi:hypothetical protein
MPGRGAGEIRFTVLVRRADSALGIPSAAFDAVESVRGDRRLGGLDLSRCRLSHSGDD